jgi:hypothetical protein
MSRATHAAMVFLLQAPPSMFFTQEDRMTQPQPRLDGEVVRANQTAVERSDEEIRKEAERIAAEADVPERQGDILGLSDVTPDVEIPRATTDRGGHPAGIEVRSPTTGTSELKQGKGATGVQMGAAGSGSDVDQDQPRPAAARKDLNE